MFRQNLSAFIRVRPRPIIRSGFVTAFLTLFLLLSGCLSQGIPPTPTLFQLDPGPTAILPTALPTALPTPTSTLVMSAPWTPTVIPTATPLPDEALGLVAEVIDAETVFVILAGDPLERGYIIRLLGVNAPPAATNAWGQVAIEKLQRWLTGEVVTLVADKTIVDEEQHLPRYLYLDGTFINLQLIEQGLARPRFQDPDTLFATEFQTAAQQAQTTQLGLWGPDPTPTPTPTSSPTVTVTPTPSSS